MRQLGARQFYLFLLCNLLCLLLIGCEDQDTNSAPIAPVFTPDGVMIRTSFINDISTTAPTLTDREDDLLAPGELANIGDVLPYHTANRDLFRELAGEVTSIDFDIDEDGIVDLLGLFIANLDDTVYLNWISADDNCHLAWSDPDGTSWYLFDLCGGGPDGPVICHYDTFSGETDCNRCLDSACESCTVDRAEIYCDPDYVPAGEEPVVEPDVGHGEDVISEDSGSAEDTGTTEDSSSSGTEAGECSDSCLSQDGAACCTECSCDAEVQCWPVCNSGFLWDCEWECCFDYDVYECDCPDGTTWNAEFSCCYTGSGCI